MLLPEGGEHCEDRCQSSADRENVAPSEPLRQQPCRDLVGKVPPEEGAQYDALGRPIPPASHHTRNRHYHI